MRPSDGPEAFQAFADAMHNAEMGLVTLQEECGGDFHIRVDFKPYCPLYETLPSRIGNRLVNINYYLKQGVSPATGLPKWGYAIFREVAPWFRPQEDSFPFHGEELKFERVEYALPVSDNDEVYSDDWAGSEDGTPMTEWLDVRERARRDGLDWQL